MFIRTENEIVSLMPTARWSRPEQLLGYLEEEERVALEPLLGTSLYMHLCDEYVRLRGQYGDITAMTVRPDLKAREDPYREHADVTERIERIHAGIADESFCHAGGDDYGDVPKEDMQAIRLIRICQQIEFYRMLAHKAGLLTVSFNEGGGMNTVSADGYDPADDKRMERVVKDAFMSAGRAVDSLLLMLEADAKGDKLFTEMWKEADAFFLHRDLLFQTARVLGEYLDAGGERMAYVGLVRDIRFCQRTYVKPRVGGALLKAVLDFASDGTLPDLSEDIRPTEADEDCRREVYEELCQLLRTALAFYVEASRREIGPKGDKLARRDSMTSAQQAMAEACDFIADNLYALGSPVLSSPVYGMVKAREDQQRKDADGFEASACRRRQVQSQQARRRLFTGFPATHRPTDTGS